MHTTESTHTRVINHPFDESHLHGVSIGTHKVKHLNINYESILQLVENWRREEINKYVFIKLVHIPYCILSIGTDTDSSRLYAVMSIYILRLLQTFRIHLFLEHLFIATQIYIWEDCGNVYSISWIPWFYFEVQTNLHNPY